jgi:hypothetical protein
MRRGVSAGLSCVLIASLAGCALVSDKTKSGGGEKKRQVKVLGLPVWRSERPAAPPAE